MEVKKDLEVAPVGAGIFQSNTGSEGGQRLVEKEHERQIERMGDREFQTLSTEFASGIF